MSHYKEPVTTYQKVEVNGIIREAINTAEEKIEEIYSETDHLNPEEGFNAEVQAVYLQLLHQKWILREIMDKIAKLE